MTGTPPVEQTDYEIDEDYFEVDLTMQARRCKVNPGLKVPSFQKILMKNNLIDLMKTKPLSTL